MLCVPSRCATHDNIDSRRLFRVDPDARAHRWCRDARQRGARNVIGAELQAGYSKAQKEYRMAFSKQEAATLSA
jgi:hypothetical protein